VVEQLTIPSRSLDVWRRLYTRYSLEPFPASVAPDVSKTIVPTTDADALLAISGVRTSGLVDIPTGTFTTMHTVPAGERWTLRSLDVFRVDGDRVLDFVAVGDPVNSTLAAIARPANVTSLTLILPTPLVLDEAWIIQITVGGGATDGDWTMNVVVSVEQTF